MNPSDEKVTERHALLAGPDSQRSCPHLKRRGPHRFVAQVATLFIVYCYMIWLFTWDEESYPDDMHSHKDPVEAVLRSTPLIDTHNDFPIALRALYKNDISNITYNSTLPLHVDFPRLKKGRLGAQFWSVYVGCPKASNNYTSDVYLPIVKKTLEQIDLVHRLIAKFPERLQLALTSKDVWRRFKHSKKPIISSLLGAEGLHQIANSPSILRQYYSLGLRYVTLTHACNNIYADSCSEEPLHGGLSKAGVAVIQEMNRIGMMVDLSHVSHNTMRDVLKITKAPVIFSHSSAFALCNISRNVPDDVLHSVKQNKGVVQVNFYPRFIKCNNAANATIEDVADHVEYIGELIGYEYVGFGADFDGIDIVPRGIEDVSKYPDLIKILLKRGVSIRDLKGVVGGNLLRVMKEAEKVSQRMVNIEPLQDDI